MAGFQGLGGDASGCIYKTEAFAVGMSEVIAAHERVLAVRGLAPWSADAAGDGSTVLYEVVHEPLVWVRDGPSGRAAKIDFKWRGERLRCVPGSRRISVS